MKISHITYLSSSYTVKFTRNATSYLPSSSLHFQRICSLLVAVSGF
nr:MAG TPA: hypothetical protein [Bacteriophage sp.]